MQEALPSEFFRRQDESSDSHFYSFPRKVVHIDEGAIAALRDAYAQILPENGVLLDLMSSWRSHLPPQRTHQRVYGLGMNAEEMADNPQLDEYVVHNLNDNPRLPYRDAHFDGAMCAVSVQYLTDPVRVFADVNRVLKPGAPFVVSFSNRCFPSKAVAAWLAMTDEQHLGLVARYFELAGNWEGIHAQQKTSGQHDPMFIVSATKSAQAR